MHWAFIPPVRPEIPALAKTFQRGANAFGESRSRNVTMAGQGIAPMGHASTRSMRLFSPDWQGKELGRPLKRIASP
jgi:hypothetical protein